MPFYNLDNNRAEVTDFLNTLETDAVLVATPGEAIADIAVDANGTAIAAAVNAIIARLVAAGIIEAAE